MEFQGHLATVVGAAVGGSAISELHQPNRFSVQFVVLQICVSIGLRIVLIVFSKAVTLGNGSLNTVSTHLAIDRVKVARLGG